MRRLMILLVLAAGCASMPPKAKAAELRISCTAPTMEADSLCVPLPFPEESNMTIRFRWSGPRAGEDSVVAVSPGAAIVRSYQTPSGTYTITGDARDAAGNWSCAVSITKLVRGRPDKVQLGKAMLKPKDLPGMLAISVGP